MGAVLSAAEVGDRLNVSEQKIRRMCEEGEFEGAFKIGRQWRIPEEAIETYVRRQQERRG